MNPTFPASQVPESRPSEPVDMSSAPWPLLPHGPLWHISKANYGAVRFRLGYPDTDNCDSPQYILEHEAYSPTTSSAPVVSTWTRSQPFTWPVSNDAIFGRPDTGLQYFPECVILHQDNARQLFTAIWALTRDRRPLRAEICREAFMRWCWNVTREGAPKEHPHLTVEELQFFEENAPYTNFFAVPPCFSAGGQNMVEIYSAVTMQQPKKAKMDGMLQMAMAAKKESAAKDEEIAALRKELEASRRKQAGTERALANSHKKLDWYKKRFGFIREVLE